MAAPARDGTRQQVFRVVRTRVTESTLPNQVLEFETVHSWSVAKAIEEIWSRKPNVKQGRESVHIFDRSEVINVRDF